MSKKLKEGRDIETDDSDGFMGSESGTEERDLSDDGSVTDAEVEEVEGNHDDEAEETADKNENSEDTDDNNDEEESGDELTQADEESETELDKDESLAQKYVPPHLRKTGSSDAQREALLRTKRQMKGHLNRYGVPEIQSCCYVYCMPHTFLFCFIFFGTVLFRSSTVPFIRAIYFDSLCSYLFHSLYHSVSLPRYCTHQSFFLC